MPEGPGGGVPVFLEGVDTDFPLLRDVRVKDLGNKVALGRVGREIVFHHQLASKDASFIGRADWAQDFRLDVGGIGLVDNERDS